ncbi:MAG TPA: hypothetical protein VMW72_22350 [Sedimentisphaerales bacterium]|nr:hypothetical protein [Sedimentisphaerales bacterium]
MRKNSFTVMKSVIVLAMLIPAVALANSHGGYSYATVTPTTVAPGGTITVEFEYTVTIEYWCWQLCPKSLWEIRLDGGTSTTEDPLIEGHPEYATDGTETFYVNVDLTIPEGTEDGPHTIDIFSVPWYTEPAPWYGMFYNISITVESDPAVAILDLIDTVAAMNLQQGIDNSLDAKLDAALNALDDVNQNNDVAAINTLNAFINAVEAQRDNKITSDQADILIAKANSIIAMLGG